MEELRIGSHLLQPNRQLLQDGEHVHLGPRALSILTVLAEANGEIVTKDELMQAVWPDVTVEENALQVHVTALRKALGEDADLLQTLRGIGYRLGSAEQRETAALQGAVASPTGVEDTDSKRKKARRPALLAALVALIIVAALSTISAFGSFGATSANTDAPSALAVLPLQVSGDEEWQRRAEALTASITSNLAQIPDLEVASETATLAVSNQGLSPGEIAERLGVDHFIEADVLAGRDRVASQVRLIEARSGRTIWTDEVASARQYADELEPLMLTRISGILLALRSVADGDVEIPDGLDPRAYEAYLNGLALLIMNARDSNTEVLRQMRLAASIEPDFAAAHAAIAYALAFGTNYSFWSSPEDYNATLTTEIETALVLNPDDFMARVAQGYSVLEREGDVETGLRLAGELLAERPTDPIAHALMALAQRMAGQQQEALNHIDQAIAGNPFNFVLQANRRRILIEQDDYFAVVQTAANCRIGCWRTGLDWWEALSRTDTNNRFYYRRDIEAMAAMFDDPRAYYTGELSRSESILSHGRFMFLGEHNPAMDQLPQGEGGTGMSHWALILFQYGYVDAGLRNAMSGIQWAPASDILTLLEAGRLTPSEEVRADPRYHALFEIPRFKAVADYRRERGLTNGLPVFPVQPYRVN